MGDNSDFSSASLAQTEPVTEVTSKFDSLEEAKRYIESREVEQRVQYVLRRDSDQFDKNGELLQNDRTWRSTDFAIQLLC